MLQQRGRSERPGEARVDGVHGGLDVATLVVLTEQ
jgi:hypothetical protein